MFLTSEGWEHVSPTEHDGYTEKSYTPNESNSCLTKKYANTFFNTMESALLGMIDDYIMVHKKLDSNSKLSDLSNVDILTYCWRFLSKRTTKAHAHFKKQFSDTMQTRYKRLSLMLYCKTRSLFRSNSKLYTFGQKDLPHCTLNRVFDICSRLSDTDLSKLRTKIQSLRCQINDIWMFILRCGSRMVDITDFTVSATETLLCWYDRSHCYNETVNKSFSEIDDSREVIAKCEKERKDIVSPHLTRLSKGAYTEEFAQKVVSIHTSTNISRSTFPDLARKIFSFVSPVVDKLGGIQNIPSTNTIKST